MKNVFYVVLALIGLLGQACIDRGVLDMKEGVSLPPVSNLALTKLGGKKVSVTWNIPTGIPESISQPLSVSVEVREVIETWKSAVILTRTLGNAPTTFEYDVVDVNKTYQFTVKINGRLKVADPNYSSQIFSLGQTVLYTP